MPNYLDKQLPFVHATSSFDRLVAIMTDGFRPSYCREEINANVDQESLNALHEHFYGNETLLLQEERIREAPPELPLVAAFPMVCFSCVDLSDATTRLKSYGDYVIALSKDWGQANRFNPVLYLEQNSDLANMIARFFVAIPYYATHVQFEFFASMQGNLRPKQMLTDMLFLNFMYTKNFYGPLARKGKLVSENYPFGYEREWRFVLTNHNVKAYLTPKDMESKDSISNANNLIGHRIPFTTDDIAAVFVKTDKEKETLAEKGIQPEKIKIAE